MVVVIVDKIESVIDLLGMKDFIIIDFDVV